MASHPRLSGPPTGPHAAEDLGHATHAAMWTGCIIAFIAAVKELAKQDIEVVANFVGEMLTVQEQAGFQMFMARMDDELLRLWNAPCNTPYLKK